MTEKITEEERERLSDRLKELDEAASQILKAREPYDKALASIESVQADLVAAVGPQRHRTVYPIVCFVDSHRPAVEWMARTLAAGTVKRQNGKAQLPQYRAQLFGKRAQLLCATLLPFLRIKDRHARLVALFPCDARIAPGLKIERSAINAERYRLRDAINALNHQPMKGA